MTEIKLKPSAARILSFIENNGSITGAQAVSECGAVDYRKRISEMVAAGIPIVGVYETAKNRFGEPVRFKRYFLREVQ